MSTSPAVVLTREAMDNELLAQALAQKGIEVVCIPCVATRYLVPENTPENFDAVTFSSRRGVRGVFKAGLTKRLLGSSPKPLIGVVGESTAEELGKSGYYPDLVAQPPEGKVLARMLVDRLIQGQRILLVRGNLRAGDMDAMLVDAGMKIVALEVYENHDPGIEARDPFDVSSVFLASPSAGRRLLQANPWMANCRFIVIGRTTQNELVHLGAVNVKRVGVGMDVWIQALCQNHLEAVKGEK